MDFKDNFEIIEEKCEKLNTNLSEVYPKLSTEEKKQQIKTYKKELEKIEAHVIELSD